MEQVTFTKTEEQLLGFVLNNPEKLDLISPFVLPEFFEKKQNEIVYKAMLKVEHPNLVDVSERLFEEGKLKKLGTTPHSYVSVLASNHNPVIPIKTIVKHVRTVAEKKMFTSLLRECKNQEQVGSVMGKVQSKFNDGFDKENESDVANLLLDLWDKREEGTVYDGCSTGYPALDNYIKGLIKGKFLVVGGYNSHGKTTLAINLLDSALKHKQKCIFFSLEMDSAEIFVKIMACRNHININKLTTKTGSKEEEEEIYKAFSSIEDANLKVRSDTDDIDVIMSIIREEKPDFVVIDYLQNLSSKMYSERREMLEYAAKKLRATALQESVCILALSQVNEENASKKGFQSGFKGSGDISSASDATIRIIREIDSNGVKNSTFKLDVMKNRYGKSGVVDLNINENMGLIVEPTQGTW